VYEPTRTHPLAFLCIPPVAWAAIRFGPRESSTATAALSLMATWNTHRGVGPFAPVGDDSLLVLQSFMATVAIMTMAMAGLVAERARVEEERRRLLAAEQRARTAVEAAMRAKDQFLAMLGHELRNPLGSIVTAIHVLDRSAVLRNDAAKARDVLRRQADHLTHLVDDLLDATRVATGKMTVHRRPVDLAGLTSQVVEAFEAAGRTVNHELVVDAQPVHVDGDPMRLEQVVSNLVGNALKFTPAGGTIHVSVAQEDGTATLRVADTGIGIPPDLLPQIFELFAQGTRGLDRAEGGLGIGLTLVKHIVELHDGAIDLRTDGPGRGCEFAVRLRAVPRPTSGSESERRGAPPGRTVARRVLVVEDQADMREILRIAIEGAGHVVAEAADGPGGVEAARRFRPDVALVDIGLPGFDGYEVGRRIRALAGPSPVVLVALTGYGQPEDRQRAQAAGFDVHLVKPIEMDRVDELLATWSPARRQVGL
jgi:signal transduction histidine kinase/CheY-like chemotaxis protein